MIYKVCLEVVVDENDVEGAVAETMMTAMNLANHSDVWPGGRTADWTFDSTKDKDWENGLPVKCTVTKMRQE